MVQTVHRIKRGLDLPISGAPEATLEDGAAVGSVALIADDYVGLKPTMAVEVGDKVKLGQVLFTDKNTPGLAFTSPAAGTVAAVHRGEKRKLLSVVVRLDDRGEVTFASHYRSGITDVGRAAAVENLVASGAWTALRERPFGRVPSPETTPEAIFVTAIDTHPLAAEPGPIVRANTESFVHGLHVARALTGGPVFVCAKAGEDVPGDGIDRVRVEAFRGPHPAGLPGTHIHLLHPVDAAHRVWHLGYQDVIAWGKLFATGRLSVERVVALGGPGVRRPRLLRTRLGASLTELTRPEIDGGDLRVISGSVFGGRTAAPPLDYLGRHHVQVSVLEEGTRRELLGWHMPGFDKFSVKRVFASALGRGGKRFAFTTNTNGSPRAMVPIGTYEQVMPLDILPTFLLRALIVGDTDRAQALGALELDEEDLALCTFVCPGKYEYGPILRENLRKIEVEG